MKKEKFYLKRVILVMMLVFLGAAFCLAVHSMLYLSGLIGHYQGYQDGMAEIYHAGLFRQVMMTVVIYPFLEEMVFRKLIFSYLWKKYGFLIGIFVSAGIFGLYHGNMMQGVYGFLAGSLLALVYAWCDTIAAPLVLHSSINGAALLYRRIGITYDQVGWMMISIILVTFLIISIRRVVRKR